MAKKHKAEIEPVVSSEGGTAAAPAKKVKTSAKSAAATHKAPARRTAKTPAKEAEGAGVEKMVATPVVSGLGLETAVAAPEPAKVHESLGNLAEAVSESPDWNEVATLAYSYYEARGYTPGDPLHDWLRAEAELSERRKLVTV